MTSQSRLGPSILIRVKHEFGVGKVPWWAVSPGGSGVLLVGLDPHVSGDLMGVYPGFMGGKVG